MSNSNMDSSRILSVMKEMNEAVQCMGAEGSIETYGVIGALEEMLPHWRSHIKNGENPEIMVTDLKALEGKIRELRHIVADAQGLRSNSTMEVSLDGGQTFEDVSNEVRVIYKNVMIDGEDEPGQMDIVLTHEGIVRDLWVSREEYLDHNIGTDSQMLDDMQSELLDD